LGGEVSFSSSASQRRFLFFFSKGLIASRNATRIALLTRDFFYYHRDHDDGIIMMDRASRHVKRETKHLIKSIAFARTQLAPRHC
jgi:hypothetical protein